MPTLNLEVIGELPRLPLLVVGSDTLEQVAKLDEWLNTAPIANGEDATAFAQALTVATELSKAIEAQRTQAKAPFLDLGRRIDDAARPPLQKLTVIIASVRDRLRKWDEIQARLRAEEERRRQEELARLERERQKAEAERLKLEEEARRKAEAVPDDLPYDAETAPAADDMSDVAAQAAVDRAAELARQQTALQAQVPAVVAKPEGITYRTTLKFEVLSIGALPTQYVIRTVDESAIRRQFCTSFNERQPLPVLPGVRFYIDRQPIVSARR
jgi:hypothetical protein